MIELTSIGLVAVKAESVYGTDPVPTKAANLIPIQKGSFSYQVDSTPEARSVMDGSIDQLPGYNTMPNATAKFQYALRGNRSTLANYALEAVTADQDSNKIALDAHTLRAGDLVKFSGTAVPDPLVADTWYFVKSPAYGDFQVAATFGGDAINLTTAGTAVKMTSARTDVSSGILTYVPEIDALLKAANLAATATAETAVGAKDGYITYSPAVPSDVGPTVGLYWWSATKLHKLTGGKVDLSIAAVVGKMIILDVTIKGRYVAVADEVFSTANAAYSDTKPALFHPTALAIGALAAPVATALNVRLGNAVALRNDLLAPHGIAGAVITDCAPNGDIDPEVVLEATHPFWANWLAGNAETISMANGADTGNKIGLTLVADVKSVNYGDRNRSRIHNVQFNVVKATAAAAGGSGFGLKFA
jgi:hypothetical protein